jgi:hypothetical protein
MNGIEVKEKESVPVVFRCSKEGEMLYMATNLEQLLIPDHRLAHGAVAHVIRFRTVDADGQTQSRLYYRVTPAVYAWASRQMDTASAKVAAGEIEQEKYARAVDRLRLLDEWVKENLDVAAVAAALNGSASAAGSSGQAELPAYDEPDFGSLPEHQCGDWRRSAKGEWQWVPAPVGVRQAQTSAAGGGGAAGAVAEAVWSSVEKKWFRVADEVTGA